MPKDAKFGLALGTGLVLLIAILFFRKEPAAARPGADPASVAVKPAGAVPAGRRTSGRKHIVQEGETLFSLAVHYYQDSTRFVELYQANREVLRTPEQLPEGAELVIPE